MGCRERDSVGRVQVTDIAFDRPVRKARGFNNGPDGGSRSTVMLIFGSFPFALRHAALDIAHAGVAAHGIQAGVIEGAQIGHVP